MELASDIFVLIFSLLFPIVASSCQEPVGMVLTAS